MPFSNKTFLIPINPQEKVYLVIRQHWIMPAIRVFFLALILAMLLVAEVIIKTLVPEAAVGMGGLTMELIRSMVLILVALNLLLVLIMYYLNVQIITNERVVDIYQRGLLHHETSELNLDNVEDVTAEIKGIFANFFDFGNVHVQTAGEKNRFTFDYVPRPHEVARTVLDLYEQATERAKAANLPSQNT